MQYRKKSRHFLELLLHSEVRDHISPTVPPEVFIFHSLRSVAIKRGAAWSSALCLSAGAECRAGNHAGLYETGTSLSRNYLHSAVYEAGTMSDNNGGGEESQCYCGYMLQIH